MPARPKRSIRQVDLGAASAEHQHTESDITDLEHYDSSDFAADHANADHSHDHDGDYAGLNHTHTESDITDLDHYTDADANAAIDARVNKAFVDALNVDADTVDGKHASAFADAAHTHVEADIADLNHYDSSDFAADHANADHTHDHDADYADIAHTHELDDLKATGATNGHVLTAQGDGTAAWEAPTGGGGVTDHGDLTGLEDDDHPQYLTVTRHDADDHSSLTITESQISDLDHYDSTDFDADFATKDTDDLAEGSTNLYLTDERVQDIIGGMLSGNTETRITVTYQDSDGTIDFEVDGDLSNYTNTLGWISDITGENLEDLANVTITSIASGEVLVWDGTGWVNRTLAEAGISAVGHTHTESDITDLDHWDQADTEGVIDAYVDKAFVDALNVDADTLDGNHASAFADAAHSHELDELDATAATSGHVLTAQGDGTAAWEPPPAVGGITDHGDLDGLTDDDHPQYLTVARHDADDHSNFPGTAKVYRSSIRGLLSDHQSIPDSANTVVVFDGVVFEDDPNGDFSLNTSTGVVTFANAGIYQVMATLAFAANSVGVRGLNIVWEDGVGGAATIAANRSPAPVGQLAIVSGTGVFQIGAGDTVVFQAFQTSGGALQVRASTATNFGIVRIA